MNAIPVALAQEHWVAVLQALAHQPWHVADPLITEIRRQVTVYKERDDVDDQPSLPLHGDRLNGRAES